MSAITGVYFMDGRPLDPADLKRMLKTVAHRGPNGSGLWFRGPVGLGHRMLWTTPESLRETLPLIHQTGDLVITADARIDNREELVSLLNINGRPLGEIADSELILRAYEKWGDSCPEKLLGDFAFAIWDAKKKLLFCARDHFGVKPFYYYRSDHAFIFASEIKALLSLQEVPRRLNEVRVADYLMSMLEDKEITFYQGILRLQPAHCISVTREGAQIRSYWALDPTREIRYNSDGEYADAFREIFTEAVRCRLRSAFPVGSMLSGGLDSSSIVCVARQLLAQEGSRQLHTFSATFENVPECDESQFINAVVARNGLQFHYVPCDQLSPLAGLDTLLAQQDEVFYAPNLFMHQALCGVAKNYGIQVLLDGIDGDTAVSHGLLYLAELFSVWKWRTLANEVRQLSRLFNRNPWTVLWCYGLRPMVPQPMRKIWRAVHGANWPVRVANPAIKADFARRIKLVERFRIIQEGSSKPARTSKGDHWRRVTSGGFPFVFEIVDKAAAAFPLELRHPLFDHKLVEFCVALPPDQKLCSGWTRIVMRRALADALPEEIRWRSGKTYLGTNFSQGLLRFEKPLLEAFVLNPPKIIDEYLDAATLRRIYHRYSFKKTEQDALTVWKAVTLGRWLQQTELTP